LRDLIKHSDFDYWEIDIAWMRWQSLTGGNDIDKAKFAHFFPELDDPDVLGSIFHAFDRMNVEDATISFSEFIKGLSVMCRGSAEERAGRACL
jgi:Ca2+-binding EF-hand superfamily protein